MPEPVLPDPVLLPEPMPVLGVEGVEVEGVEVVPLGVLPLDIPPLVEPLLDVPPPVAPLSVVMPSSFRHLSRSRPTMPRHLLLLVLPVLLPALPVLLLVPPAELLPLVLSEGDALGEDIVPLGLDVVPLGLDIVPPELDAPPEALPLSDVPGVVVAPALEPVEPLVLLPCEPEVCATETLAIAKSAAAVAVPTNLNFMLTYSVRIEGWDCCASDAMTMPAKRDATHAAH